ncbi:PREDICTED: uncharacterized protein LOC106806419 [Priapulus caudatus]|uniref:Uncharacterized protein LOC106806419 n=1 Tax=Priapulus caudatus TaxID=37621 RepID=A0ABM1DV62_PRICU|nr:PREDICTED: uncharacterized protein LOC106806419 [Priapulus caudatus]
MGSTWKVLCPPFCENDCTQKHNQMLISLVNCQNDNPSDILELEKHINIHEKSASGWERNNDIQDMQQSYRFPLLHWAAVLGKLIVVEWLLKHGCRPCSQTRVTRHTALHRSIQMLGQGIPSFRSKINKENILHLIELLPDCLIVKNAEGNLPIHDTAVIIEENNQKGPIMKAIMQKMMDEASKLGPAAITRMLNTQNIKGETALHILCRNDENYTIVKLLLDYGTPNLDLENERGQVLLDVAIDKGAMKVCSLLQQLARELLPIQEKVGRRQPMSEESMSSIVEPPHKKSRKSTGTPDYRSMAGIRGAKKGSQATIEASSTPTPTLDETDPHSQAMSRLTPVVTCVRTHKTEASSSTAEQVDSTHDDATAKTPLSVIVPAKEKSEPRLGRQTLLCREPVQEVSSTKRQQTAKKQFGSAFRKVSGEGPSVTSTGEEMKLCNDRECDEEEEDGVTMDQDDNGDLDNDSGDDDDIASKASLGTASALTAYIKLKNHSFSVLLDEDRKAYLAGLADNNEKFKVVQRNKNEMELALKKKKERIEELLRELRPLQEECKHLEEQKKKIGGQMEEMVELHATYKARLDACNAAIAELHSISSGAMV